MKKLFAFLLTVAISQSAIAELTVRDFEAVKDTEMVRFHISGIAHAFIYANVRLERSNRAPLYCAPPKLALNTEFEVAMISKRIAEARTKTPFPPDMPIGLVLLIALEETFPCTKP